MDEPTPLTEVELGSLPVFPLPKVVFFPGTKLPLHLFEPRYRSMIADCIANGPRAIAVALLRPGWEAQYEGNPPICEVAGAGRIVAHEKLADGTYNVILHGVSRVRLRELPSEGRAYRRARALLVAEHETAMDMLRASITSLLSSATAIATEVRRVHPSFALGITSGDGPARIVDIVSERLISDPTVVKRSSDA